MVVRSWSHVLQVYVDDELFAGLSMLAGQQRLSYSAYLKTLIVQALEKQKGGEPIKIPSVPAAVAVVVPVPEQLPVEMLQADDKDFEETVPAVQDQKTVLLSAPVDRSIWSANHLGKRKEGFHGTGKSRR